MRLKQANTPNHQNPKPTNWFEFITENHAKMAIPFGPHFQADIPDWTGPPDPNNDDPETQKWLGTKTWPIEDETPQTDEPIIGKGRPDSCPCRPGDNCVQIHKAENRNRLKTDLGDLFFIWKFDEMGEEVSENWNSNEEKMFKKLVKKNPISEGKSFIKPALENIPSKNRASLMSYYFNVYLLRRMSQRTGARYAVDTDDEVGPGPGSGSRKRGRADSAESENFVKSSFLTGHR